MCGFKYYGPGVLMMVLVIIIIIIVHGLVVDVFKELT